MSEVSIEAPLVRVGLRSGKLEVRAVEGAPLAVEGGGKLYPKGAAGEFVIVAARLSSNLVLTCPPGTHLIAGSESGDIDMRGELGSVRITTASGKVSIEKAGRVDVRTGTGSVEVGACREVRVTTGTGKVTIGSAEQAEISSATGAVLVREAGRVSVRTAKAAIDVTVKGDTAVESLGGAVTIRVLGGLRPSARLRSLDGRMRNDCPAGDDIRVNVQTIKGDIQVVPA